MDVNGIPLDTTASPEVTGLVNSGISQTNSQIAQGYNSGASQARGLLNAPDHMNSQLAYGTDAQSAAIKQRTNAAYGRQEQKLSLDTMMKADSDHVRNLQAASQAANEEVQTNMQKDLLKNKINQANRRARGAVVGNVLGIVGAVGGAVLAGWGTAGTGAAAGGAAGYAAGEAAGNAIGGG